MKIIEEVGHYQVCVRWMPQLLIDVHKERRKPRLLIFWTITTLEGLAVIDFHADIHHLEPESKWQSMDLHPQRCINSVCCQLEKSWLQLLGWERCYSCALLAKRDNCELWLLYWNTQKSECLPLSIVYQKKMPDVLLFHDNGRLHTNVCARGHHKFWVDDCYIHPKVLTLHHQSITCLVLWKKAYEDTIMPVMRHCKMSCGSGCRGGRPTVTRQEYVLLFKGGRKLLNQKETHWKTTVPSAVLFWNSVKFSHVELVNSMKQKIGGTTFCLPLLHMCIYTWINIWPSYVVSLL